MKNLVTTLVALAAFLSIAAAPARAQLSEQLSTDGLFAARFEWKIVAQIKDLRCELNSPIPSQAPETPKLVAFACYANGVSVYDGVMKPVKPGTITGDLVLIPTLGLTQIGLSAAELASGAVEVGIHGNMTAQYWLLPTARTSMSAGAANALAEAGPPAPGPPASRIGPSRLPAAVGASDKKVKKAKKSWWPWRR